MKNTFLYINQLNTATTDTIPENTFGEGPLEGETVDMLSHPADSLKTEIAADTFRHEGIRMPFTIEHIDSVFALLVLCFLFFAHIYNGGYNFLKENLSFLFSVNKKRHAHHGQTTTKEVLFNYFLVFQAVVLISISVYDIFLEIDPVQVNFQKPVFTILAFIILIGLFFGIKDFIYKTIGFIFDDEKSMNVWRKTHVVAIEILGILYFVPTLLLVYSQYYHFQIIVFMVILFLIVQILLFYQIIIFFIREKFNYLFLIAYLCTFEILPYIFLGVGLAKLYSIDVFNIL